LMFRRCGYSATTRPRLSHMPATTRAISVSGNSGTARLMLRRAIAETPREGPMRRASAPPRAEAQSRGNNLNAPNESAAPQASRRSAKRGASAAVTLGHVVPIAVADSTTAARGLADIFARLTDRAGGRHITG